MNTLLGTTFDVFFVITICIMGFAAYMTGQALANTWKPWWHVLVYCVLLGFADRFLTFGLFDGDGLSVTGYLVDTTVIVAIGLFGYRFNQAAKIVRQYPWLYERAGVLSWRDKAEPRDQRVSRQ